jgi:hypothetical protein
VHEIHNPVVRLVRERELFAALGFPNAKVLTQMNPDVSLTLRDEGEAERAAEVLRGLYVHPGKPLFEVERRSSQVFLELLMPRRQPGETLPPIRHITQAEFQAPFERHVHEHPTNDQSTAQHDEPGFLLAYSAGRSSSACADIPVTDIAPTILSWFGIGPQPWMKDPGAPAIASIEPTRQPRPRLAGRRRDRRVARHAGRDRLPRSPFAVKLAITVGLFAYLLSKVEIAPVVRQLRAMAPAAAVGAEALLAPAARLLACAGSVVNRDRRVADARRSGSAADGDRPLLQPGPAVGFRRRRGAGVDRRARGRPLGPVVRAIVCDRVVGLLVLVVMVSADVSSPCPMSSDPTCRRRLASQSSPARRSRLAALFLLGAPLGRLLMRTPAHASRSAGSRRSPRVLFRSRGRSAVVVPRAGGQLLNVAAMHWCAVAWASTRPRGRAGHRPAVMLVSMAPVSFAGLGRPRGRDDRRPRPRRDRGGDALAVSVAFGCAPGRARRARWSALAGRRGGAARWCRAPEAAR